SFNKAEIGLTHRSDPSGTGLTRSAMRSALTSNVPCLFSLASSFYVLIFAHISQALSRRPEGETSYARAIMQAGVEK
ncbi:MAG: hypothetical protein ACLPSF_02890, partial [Methylocella sp.]